MKHIVMIGPSPTSRGGIASVIGILLEHGYLDDPRCRFLPTHVDGSRLRKAGCAASALTRFGCLLLRGRVALLHVHVASGASFWRKAVFIGTARLFGTPVLFHMHGGHFRNYLDNTLHGWRQRLARRVVASATAGFALTAASVDWLREDCRLQPVELFPNPVPPAVRPANAVARQRDLLFLGRLETLKGVYDLVEAFVPVHAQFPDARLILAGEGDQPGVLALARRLGVADRVVLPGWVGPDRRAELLAQAAMFVLPSHVEQMPMSILEAMAAGTPVVACAVGAVPEMLAHGKSGSIVPIGNVVALSTEMIRILRDNSFSNTLAMHGLERVQAEYMVDTVIHRLRRRYEELINVKSSVRRGDGAYR